jgi:hypothetical protein
MRIYTALKKGEYHLHHCEDYLCYTHLSNQIFVCAVMDGCTMGTDSYFASTLTGKLLRKIVNNIGYRELITRQPVCNNVEEYLQHMLRELFTELRLAKGQLLLERNELLTTLINLLVDKKAQCGMAMVIGDGVVCVDGLVHEFEQDNRPDYIGYHLHENFEEWLNRQVQKVYFSNAADISIATDGIATFENLTGKQADENIMPLQLLLAADIKSDTEDALEKRLTQLEHIHGLVPTDDLAVIRLLF